MGNRYQPFDPGSTLGGCSCGRHADEAAHHAAKAGAAHDGRSADGEAAWCDAVEAAAVRALFPRNAMRRAFIRAVGKSTAIAAVYSVLPIASLQQAFAQTKATQPEKRDLNVGFLPITCATPLIAAEPLGFCFSSWRLAFAGSPIP